MFLTNSHLSALCVPAEEGVAEERLLRGQREAYRVHWPGGGVEFHPSHGDWVRLLRGSGFVVEALHEIYAPPDGGDHPFYEIVSAEWASQWPAEELWVGRPRALRAQPVSVVCGCTGSGCGGRGGWVKSKSLGQVAQPRVVLADVRPRVGRPSVRGSSRWPPRKSSSMNFT